MRLILLLLAACREPVDNETAAPACDADLLDEAAIVVTVSDTIPTNVTLDLTTTAAADVTVTLDAEGAPTVAPPTWQALDGAASLPLYGMRPDTTYTARVIARSGDACEAVDVPVSTGSLPPHLPSTTLDIAGDRWGTYTLVGWLDPEDYYNTGAVILDEGGEIVWFFDTPLGTAVSTGWALGASGDVLLRAYGQGAGEQGAVFRVSMAGEIRETVPLTDGHHEIGHAPDLAFAYLRAVARDIDGETIVGDEIVEVSPDGTERVAWNAFDCLPEVEEHMSWGVETAPIAGIDWTHANGLSYCAADDTWLISLYYLREIHKIRRSDCTDVWMIDGDYSSGRGYTIPALTDGFGPQHAPSCTDEGLVLVDNRIRTGDVTRGLALALDADTQTATSLWAVPHPDGSLTTLLGSTDPLPDGDTLIGWGGLGELSVNDPTGVIGWRVITDATLGSVNRREGLYGE